MNGESREIYLPSLKETRIPPRGWSCILWRCHHRGSLIITWDGLGIKIINSLTPPIMGANKKYIYIYILKEKRSRHALLLLYSKKQKLKTQKGRFYFSKLKSNYYTKDHLRLWAYCVKRKLKAVPIANPKN